MSTTEKKYPGIGYILGGLFSLKNPLWGIGLLIGIGLAIVNSFGLFELLGVGSSVVAGFWAVFLTIFIPMIGTWFLLYIYYRNQDKPKNVLAAVEAALDKLKNMGIKGVKHIVKNPEGTDI